MTKIEKAAAVTTGLVGSRLSLAYQTLSSHLAGLASEGLNWRSTGEAGESSQSREKAGES